MNLTGKWALALSAILNLGNGLTNRVNRVITCTHDQTISSPKVLSGLSSQAAWVELPDHRKARSNTKYALLDPLPATEFASQYEWIWRQASHLGGLKAYETSLNTRLIGLDGMVYHTINRNIVSLLRHSSRPKRANPMIKSFDEDDLPQNIATLISN